MSPDWSAKEEPVPYATMDDPQSLNLYAYVRNNPLRGVDPDGHAWRDYARKAQQWAAGHPRTLLTAKAGLNVAVAAVKISEAAAGAVAAPETGGLTLAVTIYQGVSAAGNIAAAGSQLAGAITGDVKNGEAGAKVVNAATTISGVTTLVATGGDIGKADRAATLENAATTIIGAGGLLAGTPGQVAAKTTDAAQTVVDTANAIKSPQQPLSCDPNNPC